MILAIETSSKLCSVALIENGSVVDAEEAMGEKFIHAEALHPMIQNLLQRNQLTPAQLTAIAVGIGPGSYTGLRIGLAAAKGFAYALNIPLYAANTNELLRASLAQAERSLPIYTVVDARRQDAFVASPSGEYAFQTIDQNWRAQVEEKNIVIVGDCADKAATEAMDIQVLRYPSAKFFAEVLKTNLKFVEDVGALEPFYLKEFEPTVSKKKITDL
jgi:tRNA threonylcarbamoyladenosine biosynthesis protein TsaB